MTSNITVPPVQDEELGNIGERGNDIPLTHQSDATGINAASNSNEAAATTAGGTNHDARMILEQFDDDVEPYRPTMGESDDENQILKGKVHVEEIKDNANPDHELSHLTDGMANETKKIMAAAAPTKLEQIDDVGFPVHPTEFEDDIDAKMKAKTQTNNDGQAAVQSDDEESICIPTNEEIEGEPEVVTRGVNVIRNRGNAVPRLRPLVDVGESEDVENGDPNMERESSVPVIPQAFLVEESDVVVATPTIPWWKQRRTRFLLCFVFVVVIVLSVALGVAFSSREQSSVELRTVLATPSPSFSLSPSSSQVPSSSPSSCSDTVVTNMQKFNLLRPDLDSPKVAIDGRHMVVVSKFVEESSVYIEYDEGSLYIEFYYLNDGDEWEQVLYTIEADFEWEWYLYSYDVSVSGETAAVGLPAKEVVYIYQRDIYGLWAQIDVLEPTKRSGCGGFGKSVQVDDDILVVVDSHRCFAYDVECGSHNTVHIFERNADKWKEIDVFTDDDVFFVDSSVKGGVIAVAGQDAIFYRDANTTNTIDLYQHATHNNIITLMQRIETRTVDGWINSLDVLSDHHLILSLTNKISIFYRADPNQDFSYLQHLNTSDYEDGFGRAITMQKGILAIGGGTVTHFFAEQDDGMFEETLVIDQWYANFELSGRTLVAAKDTEVYILDIEGCTQAVPTQAPTLTIAPTSCFAVDLTFKSQYEWTAVIEKIESAGAVTVKSYSHIWEDGSYSLPDQYEDSLCLAEGRYQFSIRGVGDSEQPEKLLSAHYSVQSEGRVISQGGSDWHTNLIPEVFFVEVLNSTEFDLPFDPLAATSPTGSPYISRRPTWRPTQFSTFAPITPFPTPSQPFKPRPTTIEPLPTSSPEPAGPTKPLPTWSPSTTQASETPTANPTNTASTQLPSNSESKPPAKVCLDQSECAKQLEKTGLESFNVGEYPDYGCFMKGDKLYWGTGGTNEQLAIDPLSGAKERVWC